MMLLLRNRAITSTTAVNNDTTAENSETVAVAKIKELLPQIRELKNCRLNFRLKRDGNIVLKVDDVTYQTTDD